MRLREYAVHADFAHIRKYANENLSADAVDMHGQAYQEYPCPEISIPSHPTIHIYSLRCNIRLRRHYFLQFPT